MTRVGGDLLGWEVGGRSEVGGCVRNFQREDGGDVFDSRVGEMFVVWECIWRVGVFDLLSVLQ